MEKNILNVIGFGPGKYEGMTIEAKNAMEKSDIIVGYKVYVELVKPYFKDKEYAYTMMTKEVERVEYAVQCAKDGKVTSLICSGDPVLYGMAALAHVKAQDKDIEVKVINGVTAALSGSGVLGAPLTHDFCVISLSDLLTPWELIEKRLKAAAMGDFAIAIYNPSSKKRSDYLKKACDILLDIKSPDTVCGYVKNIGRDGEESCVLTLSKLREENVDMFTTVFIGNSQTFELNGKMITPRGYKID